MCGGSNAVYPNISLASMPMCLCINTLLLSWSIQIKLITCQTKLLLKFQCCSRCVVLVFTSVWRKFRIRDDWGTPACTQIAQWTAIERWDKIDFPFRVGKHFRWKCAGWLADWRSRIGTCKINERTEFILHLVAWNAHTRRSIWISTENTYETFTAIETLVEFSIWSGQIYWNNFSWGITMGMWLFPSFLSFFFSHFLSHFGEMRNKKKPTTKLIHFGWQCLLCHSQWVQWKSRIVHVCLLLLWVSNCLSLFISFLLDGIVLSPSKSVYLP